MGENAGGNPLSEEMTARVAKLFAGLGYDGVNADLIESLGVDPAALEAAGGKAGLYESIMAHLYEEERSVLESAIAEATPDAAGAHHIVDAYVDHCLQHPHQLALWAHRWLDDAADLADLERRYYAPLFSLLDQGTADIKGGVDPRLAIATVRWCVQGFFGQGLVQPDGYRKGPGDPEALREFRNHLHHLVDMMLETEPR